MADKVEKRILTLYSDVQATSVHWLWYPFIAVGKITLLQGDPGDGKSTMMMNLIAELSKGGKTPDGKPVGTPQRVIYQCSEDGVYVELLLNSVERCIAIRPCDKNNPNAIRWGRLKEGRWCASTLGCRGLAKTLFDIMEWDEDLRYRFRGQFLEQGDNKMMLFAFDEPEMIKVEEIVLPPKENTEEDEGETVKKKIYIFPPEWAGTFGQPITSIAQVGILRQEHYAGNWDVFRPATEIEEMNIFTAESLNELLREAEKIMEGWTDYR